MDLHEAELDRFFEKVEKLEGNVEYVAWSREKDNTKGSIFHSAKNGYSDNSNVYAEKLRKELIELSEHTERMVAQYRRIKEIKNIVADPANK